jgi:hypothetical protein
LAKFFNTPLAGQLQIARQKLISRTPLPLEDDISLQTVAKSCFRLFSPADDGDGHDAAASPFIPRHNTPNRPPSRFSQLF